MADFLAWWLVLALALVAGWLIFAGMTDAETAAWCWGTIAAASAFGAVGIAIVEYKARWK